MTYPAETWLGTSAPRFRFASLGARAVREVAAVTAPDTAETLIAFTPVRRDGGDAFVTLANGQVINRSDGFRARVTFSWANLTASELGDLRRVFARGVSVEVNPHQDTPIWWPVVPVGEFAPTWPGGIYVGHMLTLEFVTRDVLTDIPRFTGSGVAQPGFRPLVH